MVWFAFYNTISPQDNYITVNFVEDTYTICGHLLWTLTCLYTYITILYGLTPPYLGEAALGEIENFIFVWGIQCMFRELGVPGSSTSHYAGCGVSLSNDTIFLALSIGWDIKCRSRVSELYSGRVKEPGCMWWNSRSLCI